MTNKKEKFFRHLTRSTVSHTHTLNMWQTTSKIGHGIIFHASLTFNIWSEHLILTAYFFKPSDREGERYNRQRDSINQRRQKFHANLKPPFRCKFLTNPLNSMHFNASVRWFADFVWWIWKNPKPNMCRYLSIVDFDTKKQKKTAKNKTVRMSSPGRRQIDSENNECISSNRFFVSKFKQNNEIASRINVGAFLWFVK